MCCGNASAGAGGLGRRPSDATWIQLQAREAAATMTTKFAIAWKLRAASGPAVSGHQRVVKCNEEERSSGSYSTANPGCRCGRSGWRGYAREFRGFEALSAARTGCRRRGLDSYVMRIECRRPSHTRPHECGCCRYLWMDSRARASPGGRSEWTIPDGQLHGVPGGCSESMV